jgi:hypothetical protein
VRRFARHVAAAGALAWAGAQGALAKDPRYPDWPCQQLKVPQMALASVWSGPSLEGIDKTKPRDPAETDLVTRLAARRTSMDEAKKLIAAFITGAAAEKLEKAELLFSDLFDTLNAQRTEVMDGIERFSRKQKNLAEAVRGFVVKMRALQDAPNPDAAKIEDVRKQVEWNTRVFEDRQKSTTYVCEVPTIIERRLYELAQVIRQAAK